MRIKYLIVSIICALFVARAFGQNKEYFSLSDVGDPASRHSNVASKHIVPRQFALKTNLAMLGLGVSNVAGELYLNKYFSLNFPFIYSPYTISTTWKLRILAVQPELRYWFGSQTMSGHFAGIASNVAFYNVAVNAGGRYQDKNENIPLWSFGVTYGYVLDLCRNFALEFTVGGGYARIQYDVFEIPSPGLLRESGVRNYWGITQAGISLSYKFNK